MKTQTRRQSSIMLAVIGLWLASVAPASALPRLFRDHRREVIEISRDTQLRDGRGQILSPEAPRSFTFNERVDLKSFLFQLWSMVSRNR